MNYPLKNAIIDFVNCGNSKNLSHIVKEQIDHYPSFSLNSIMNILATHDTFRILSAVGGVNVYGLTKEEMSTAFIPENMFVDAVTRLKAAVLLQYTLYGVPSVYYGDEIGMQGYTDPLNRCFFKWDNINDEIRSFYVFLGKIRAEYDAFIDGKVNVVSDKDGVFCFTRCGKESEFFVAENFGEQNEVLTFNGELTDLLSGKTYTGSMLLPCKSFFLLASKGGVK